MKRTLNDLLSAEKPEKLQWNKEWDCSLMQQILILLDEIAKAVDRGYSWNQICEKVKEILEADGKWNNDWNKWSIKEYYTLASTSKHNSEE